MIMKILVTGGAGFIGSHLCDTLIEKSHKVYCLDNCSSGSIKNIEHLLDEQNFNYIGHDVTQNWNLKIDNVDKIYHLASRASPKDFKKYPFDIAKTNSIGTLNAIEHARKNDARFLLASTSEIYGDPEVHPQKESYNGNVNNLGPRAPYDIGKSFAESVTQTAHREYGLDTRIVRIFNTYGPRMLIDDGRVIPNFSKQALKGEPLTVYGDGKQTRSFCYISDLISGMFDIMNSNDLRGDVINLGNPREITILELAKKIIEISNTSSKITNEPLPSDDPKRRKPDISKIKEKIGWKPKVSLEEGLKKTLQYFEENLQ